MKSGENFKLLYDLADQLHAACKVVPNFIGNLFIISFIYSLKIILLFPVFKFLSETVSLILQVNDKAFSEEWASPLFFIIYATLNWPNLSSFSPFEENLNISISAYYALVFLFIGGLNKSLIPIEMDI